MQEPASGPLRPTVPAASRVSPRVTWIVLHLTGLGLLRLSGGWPAWPEHEPLPGFHPFELLLLLTLLFYAAASFTDPGYLPIGADSASAAERGALQEALLALPECEHCKARQGPRAKHCHDCGRCVRRMDHHCWWLGNCVGERNHRVFLAYLVFQTTLLGWVVALAWRAEVTPKLRKGAPLPSIAWAAGALALTACALLGLLSLVLLVFQSALVLRGETTWEHLRRERINAAASLPPKLRPYDAGPLCNLLGFCCGCSESAVVAPGAAHIALAGAPQTGKAAAEAAGEATPTLAGPLPTPAPAVGPSVPWVPWDTTEPAPSGAAEEEWPDVTGAAECHEPPPQYRPPEPATRQPERHGPPDREAADPPRALQEPHEEQPPSSLASREAASASLADGDLVWYQSGSRRLEAKVLKVDFEVNPPSYVILLEGKERGAPRAAHRTRALSRRAICVCARSTCHSR